MADVRCPMCGKPNPDTLDVCQYCQARLKPLTAPLGEPIRPGDEPTKKSTAELEQILPEWLRKARHPEEDSAAAPADAGDMPLTNGKAKQAGQSASNTASDLLSGLMGQNADEDEDVPEWLAEIRAESGAPAEQETAHEHPPQEEPADWLSELRSKEPIAETTPPSEATGKFAQIGSELPEWLSGLESEQAREEASTWSSEPQAASIPQDLLADSGQPEQDIGQPATQKGELPDWLSEMKSEPASSGPEAGTETPDTGELLGSTDLPDWLSGLDAASGAPISEETPASHEAPTIPAAFDGASDWLGVAEEKTQEQASAPATSDDTVLPPWLASAMGEPPAPAQEAEPPALAGELPDWLAAMAPGTAGIAGEQEPASSKPESQGTPDWLSGMGSGTAVFAGEQATESSEPTAQETPDWLSGLGPGAAVLAGEQEQSPVHPEPAGQEVPDWLTSLPQEKTSASVSPFDQAVPEQVNNAAPVFSDGSGSSPLEVENAFSMEMPDWLSAIKPSENQAVPAGPQEPGTAPAADEAGIAPAALPSWVQAMRPVESAVSAMVSAVEGEEANTVTEGPLAGLSGVLPAGPAIISGRKPQAYAIKLQADDDQQSNAALLEKLLENETKPKALTSPSLILTARILRWAIFVLLLLAVGLPLLFKTTFTPEASLFPNETLETVQVVNGLAENSSVLLVFDYEPAFSAEMEAAAAPLVDHLMLNGVKLSILSTSPSGPVLSEQFLARTQADHNYAAGIQYFNMGYLPGGSAGVLGFAQSPRRAMPRATHLEDVTSIQDFEAVIVLTDNADGGQAWIEQAQPLMADRPLLMVASAQIEAVIRPYVDSGQIKGMVSGLAGGSAYETINGRPGLGRRYWDGFSVGLFVAGIMIITGGLWSLVAAWNARRAINAGEV